MKFRKILMPFFLGAFLLLTGCANISQHDKVFDVTEFEQQVQVGKTTLSELREILGTPTFIGENKEGTKFVAFAFSSSMWKNFGVDLLKSELTFGLARQSTPYTLKVVYIPLDKNDVATGIDFWGIGFITYSRVLFWNEAERELTEDEIKTPISYSDDELYELYFQQLSKDKGVPVSELTDEDKYKEFPHCNLYCQALKGAIKLFGPFKMVDPHPAKLETDRIIYFYEKDK